MAQDYSPGRGYVTTRQPRACLTGKSAIVRKIPTHAQGLAYSGSSQPQLR